MFDKPITELAPEDIERLIEERVIEGIDIEFKETLPSKKGNDPWIEGKDKIGDYARNQILEEIIAFANAYGGVLCIGISESDDTPASADGINALPRCNELVERLKLQCRDCIEPQIPLLEVSGVTTNESEGGVVIIHIPQSRLAPHRHLQTRECYVRRADRAEKMTMREIQDLTLHTERGMAKIDGIFNNQKNKFEKRVESFGKTTHGKKYGVRITALPTSDIYLNDIHNHTEVKSDIQQFTVSIGGQSYKLYFPFHGEGWKPILRGTYTESRKNTDYFFSTEIQNSGLVELVFLSQEGKDGFIIVPEWFMGMFCNTLNYLHRLRKAARTQNVEYALEIQFMNLGDPLNVYRYGGPYNLTTFAKIRAGNVIFPRYSVGAADSFQQLSNVIETDFWNHSGQDTSQGNIQINFDELLR